MPAPDPANVLSVTALNQKVRTALERNFQSVWVCGEVSNYHRHGSGHQYFSLKDDKAVLKAALFRGVGVRVRFELRDGMQVVARGRPTLYEPRGEFQLQIEEIHPKGKGALELALAQLRDKLQARGYFDPLRKKKLPAFPRTIALVTSPSGAAVRDMLELLARRWPVARVVVVPVRVQGEGAAQEIAAALRALNRLHGAGALCLDAIIVGRGGGSLEDLWAFNEEPVADAIYASKVAVVSAVGHEIDVTIADLVADHRALTPSHAVTDLTPDRAVLLAGMVDLGCRLRERMRWRLDAVRRRLDSLAERRVLRSPLERIRDQEERLDDLDGRLGRATGALLERSKARIAAAAGRLESLSPLGVLARGYSLTRTPAGQVVRDARTVRIADELVTRLAVGEVVSCVVEVRPSPKETP